MEINEQLKELTNIFWKHSHPEKAREMSHYMKGHFSFYGIHKPLRTKLSKAYIKTFCKLSEKDLQVIVSELWNKPQREYQYFVLDILYKVTPTKKFIGLYERLIIKKSWWDSVDNIASRLVGPYFMQFPGERNKYIKKWTSSKNIWLNRTAILFQLKYKKETDQQLLFKTIQQHKGSDEFFIQKAIGWALRAYAYTDAKAVKKFVKGNALKPLSVREALKHVK